LIGNTSRILGAGVRGKAPLRLLLLCAALVGGAGRPGLDSFLLQVRERRLDTLSTWHALGRWEGHEGSWKGGIDGGYFYLDSLGRTDPVRELAATIRALSSDSDLSLYARDTTPMRIHPRVKYRARTRFLLEHGMPDSLFAKVDSSRWTRWRDGVRPHQATLVYASNYLGNPASMFGHVLLRFDAPDRVGLKDRLNYGITYGAGMPPGDPLYVPKGLFGLYPGFLSIMPYYLSLQKYKYLESRDLWEYPLALDSTQTEKLLEIVWESGGAWNRYYFITENCATGMARLLDVLQPDSAWSRRFPSPSIPPELVRLFHDRGFAGDPVRRPSQLAIFLQRREVLTEPERGSLRKTVDGDLSDTLIWTGSEATRILDAGIDYLGWQRRNHPKDSTWRQRQDSLLTLRAGLKEGPTDVVFPTGQVLPPESGHRPRYLEVYGGGDGESSREVGILGKVAYHALEDRPDGYLDGSEVESGVLDASWVVDGGEKGFHLHRVDILKIRSVPIWDSWLRPWAWMLRFGARPFGFESTPWVGAEFGRGMAFGSKAVRLWSILGARAAIAPWDEMTDFVVGPQLMAGFLVSTSPVSVGLEGSWFEGLPTRKREALLGAVVRVSPVRDLDLDLRASVDPDLRRQFRGGLGWHM